MKKFMIYCATVVVVILSLSAQAFTTEEKALLKTAATTEPTIATCISNGNDPCVEAWFNATTTFVVWRNSVTQDEYQSREDTGTSFDWASTGGFIARSQGERDAWRTMFQPGFVDPSKANVIAAFNNIFSGSGVGAVANRAHLLAVSKRFATNAEKILATGTGTDITPGRMSFVGIVSTNDVSVILRN